MCERRKPMAEVKKTSTVKTDTVEIAGNNSGAEKVSGKEAKTTARKTTTKTTAKAAVKKAPVKKETKAATKATEKTTKTPRKKTSVKPTVNLQFSGKSYSIEDLTQIAEDVWKYDLHKDGEAYKSLELYVKPEENVAYYVFNEDIAGSFFI